MYSTKEPPQAPASLEKPTTLASMLALRRRVRAVCLCVAIESSVLICESRCLVVHRRRVLICDNRCCELFSASVRPTQKWARPYSGRQARRVGRATPAWVGGIVSGSCEWRRRNGGVGPKD